MIKAAENHPKIVSLAKDMQAIIGELHPELSNIDYDEDIVAWIMAGDYEALESGKVAAQDIIDEWILDFAS